MLEHLTATRDGVQIRYACSEPPSAKPALLFVIPFGLKLDLAEPFFDRFKDFFRVICWEARLILAPAEHLVSQQELTVEHHVADLFAILDTCGVERAHIVGYCSGAGIALAAVNAKPERFGALVLVSGEYTLLGQTACVTQFGRDIDSLLPMASKDRKTAQFILERMPDQHRLSSERQIPEGIKLPFSQVHFFQRYALNYLSYRSVNYQQLASTVTNRTLLIACQRDLQTNINSTMQIKKHMSNSSIFIEPEGDHYELLRVATRVMAVTRDFLTGECAVVS
jgi:pimeloyl-ACP methyl ester carboxylesterase